MNDDRDNKIVELLQTGDFTVREVADKVGVSRQTVSTVFKKSTGDTYMNFKENMKKVDREEEERLLQTTWAYDCTACGDPVTVSDARIKLCTECYRLQHEEGRLPHVWVKCSNCGKDFHPYRSLYHKNKNKPDRKMYCDKKCYHSRNKKK